MKNKKVVIISIVFLVAIFVIGGYMYKSNVESAYQGLAEKKDNPFKRDYSFVYGNKDAKVQLVEFFDPACATCAQFYPLVKDYMKKHEGKINVVFRYAPFHKNSIYAVKMLAGANEQGKLQETLEFMFNTRNYWIKDHVVQHNTLWNMLINVKGLDLEVLSKFMDSKKADEIINQELADIETLNVKKTPSYFVNGKPLVNFGWEPLKELIESEL